jgi:hypothetical protein
MNGLKEWVVRSREQQRRAPERYLASYPNLRMDDTHVLMTEELLEKITRACGRYDATIPTGAYLGKMFVRGGCLCWFSIDTHNPMTHYVIQCRTIQMVE